MIEKSFYVNLPSNTSVKSFPKNTKSNFTTLLEEAIELNNKYEVALVEISNFSSFAVDFGHIVYENLYGFFSNEKRHLFNDVKLQFKNGISLLEFSKKLNSEILINFIKNEYMYRYRKAYKEKSYNNCDLTEKIINVFQKKAKKTLFEIQVNDDFKFSDQMIYLGGLFDTKNKKFVFENIDRLSQNFDLIILTCPEIEDDESILERNSFYIDKINFFDDDHIIIRQNSNFSIEKILVSNILPSTKINLIDKFNAINNENQTKTKNKISLNFNLSEYLPKIIFLEPNYFQIASNISIKLNGLISKIITNSNKEEYICRNKEIFLMPEFIQTVKSILVYTDIIEDQYFGDVRSQILRILNIKSSESVDTLHIANPHYLKVKSSRISSINIEICDISGNQIKYTDNFSNLNITLHFRQK